MGLELEQRVSRGWGQFGDKRQMGQASCIERKGASGPPLFTTKLGTFVCSSTRCSRTLAVRAACCTLLSPVYLLSRQA